MQFIEATSRKGARPVASHLRRAYVALFLAPKGKDGTRTISLARYGTFEVRLIELPDCHSSDASPPGWSSIVTIPIRRWTASLRRIGRGGDRRGASRLKRKRAEHERIQAVRGQRAIATSPRVCFGALPPSSHAHELLRHLLTHRRYAHSRSARAALGVLPVQRLNACVNALTS
jgi:hypothetical protein